MYNFRIKGDNVAPQSISKIRGLVFIERLKALCLLFAIVLTCLNGRAEKVLILGPTVIDGENSLEALAAEALGYTVDIVDSATWRNMAATNPTAFSSYRAIILGDPNTNDVSLIAAADDTKSTWAPRITGNVIVMGTDPADHASVHMGAIALISKGISFAANETNKTGLYVCLSEYYDGANPNTAVPVLATFGDFKVRGQGPWDDAHIVAWHPRLNGLSDQDIGNWNYSVHEVFDKWPENFQVFASVQDIAPSPFLAQDGSLGKPYILLRSATNAAVPITLLGCASSPYLINVQFGKTGTTVNKTGIAGIGHSNGDYWNVLNINSGGQASNSVTCLDNGQHSTSLAVNVSIAGGGNIAGGNGNAGDDTLLKTYVSPPTGGSINLKLTGLPAGKYDLYLYAAGEPIALTTQRWNATFSILSGVSGVPGIKVTSAGTNWDMNVWTENNQYVVFRDVQVIGGNANPVVIGVTGDSISNKPLINAMQIVRKSYQIAGLTAVPAANIVNLHWQPAPGVTNYNIQRMSSSSSYYTVATGITGTNFVNTGLTTGETYTYQVTAGDACAPVEDSVPVTTTTYYTIYNLQFGSPYNITVKTGLAAIGNDTNDYWNVIAIDRDVEPLPDAPLGEVACLDSKQHPSPVIIDVVPGVGDNAVGGAESLGADPLLNNFLYTPSGDVWIMIQNLPVGTYDISVYATGWLIGYPSQCRTDAKITLINIDPNHYSTSTLYTSSSLAWDIDTWVEGNQYVTFSSFGISNSNQPIVLRIQGDSNPGMPVVNGLQILRLE